MTVLLLMLSALTGWLILSAICSGLETASYAVNRTRLSTLREEGNHRAGVASGFLHNMPGLITMLLVANNVVNYMASYTLSSYLEVNGVTAAAEWTTALLTPVCLIFSESLPKRIACVYPMQFLLGGTWLLPVSRYLFWPVCAFLGAFTFVIRRLLNRLGMAPHELTGKNLLAENLEASAAEGVLSQTQLQMTRKIMELGGLQVGQVMLRPEDAVTVCDDQTCAQAGQNILGRGFARALLIDKRGVLTGELITLNAIMRSPAAQEQPITALAQEAMRLDAQMPVLQAIQQMRAAGARLAVATGPGGQPVGALPFTRLLGHVTGNIRL